MLEDDVDEGAVLFVTAESCHSKLEKELPMYYFYVFGSNTNQIWTPYLNEVSLKAFKVRYLHSFLAVKKIIES